MSKHYVLTDIDQNDIIAVMRMTFSDTDNVELESRVSEALIDHKCLQEEDSIVTTLSEELYFINGCGLKQLKVKITEEGENPYEERYLLHPVQEYHV